MTDDEELDAAFEKARAEAGRMADKIDDILHGMSWVVVEMVLGALVAKLMTSTNDPHDALREFDDMVKALLKAAAEHRP